MTALEYILDGLEAELELERELGVRTVEFDRALLATPPAPPPRSGTAAEPPRRAQAAEPPRRAAAAPAQPPPVRSEGAAPLDFVFLHHRRLSEKGVEMMAKIVLAMKRTPDTAPIVVAPPRPAAKISVVLGGNALKMWFPGVAAAPGQWVRTDRGEDVLVTYSPEYILRYSVVTPALRKIKSDMWASLKEVMRRTGA